ncbi:optic atrophy 3 protein-domain-containing protein [Amylostereum chailletii]|nr:optic atrophy 3 protein-domain-containing protein [Amylostereum chailletii]
MATTKIATLVIRTLAKPISNRIKIQAKEHDRFRKVCVSLAQTMYRTEANLRTNLLGEPAKHLRPLSEARAIDNGANFIAEGFLFSVAAALIGETWRSSRNQSKRRDDVDDALEDLQAQVRELGERLGKWETVQEERSQEEQTRNEELTRILERVVDIGIRGGWMDAQDTPLQVPRIHTPSPTAASSSSPPPSSDPPSDSGHAP